jgi:restriction endonuclease Mrr
LAAAYVDVQRALLDGRRPRFRVAGGKIAPVEWLLDGELLRLERDLQGLIGRYREASRRSLQRQLADLPQRALGELVTLLLERRGVTNLERVRRQGAHSSELHLSGSVRGAQGGVRTAFFVRRDGREIGRERVIELRGGLHHYGPAHAGWLVTTGQVLSGAREEAGLAGAAPITLIDGAALAQLCEETGIGVTPVRAMLPIVDATFFDALRSAG